MAEAQELKLHIREQVDPARSSPNVAAFAQSQSSSKLRKWQWWFLVFFYSFLILAGQTSGTLLGRFYYNQGGKSLWMATIVPSSGFPLLVPLLLILRSSSTASAAAAAATVSRPSIAKLATIYIGLGLIGTGDNLMYSYGLLYLPVSTFSLVCATQLAFNAVFSYFLNSQKFTPFIFNSIILLTLAAALLGVHSDGGSASGHKYPLGLALTLAASAVFSLILSLTQLAFQKVIKTENVTVVMEMILWTGLVSTVASVVGLFAGGEWKGIHEEFIGSENGLPLVPIFAVVFFHERMDGVKAVALLIAILGFVNYVYQHFLDDTKEKRAMTTRDEHP
ncbi:hypothetical protein M5K25_010152 [Dendrobium thyrsiflorum]|uniref:Probable purine permease n=1 Tax=Dendrobium thyrsiflorum TaxID=117978 RepID=A0ABD0UZV8_DENTH